MNKRNKYVHSVENDSNYDVETLFMIAKEGNKLQRIVNNKSKSVINHFAKSKK